MGDLNSNSVSYPSSIDTYTEETASDLTDFNPVNGAANAAVAIEAELGVSPSQNKATVLAYLQAEHDADGEHTYKVPHLFYQDNVAASQSAVALAVVGPASGIDYEMPWAGSIVGISAQVASAEARTAGTLTVDATINGTVTGLQAVLDGTNTQNHSATQAKDTDAFVAGDLLGCKITTDAGWLPVSADLIVVVYVSFN